LIQLKAVVKARGHASSITGDQPMPVDSLIVAVCVVAMFVVFAGVLFWGDMQTRPKHLAPQSTAKRRAF
jgi:hypothetical protein